MCALKLLHATNIHRQFCTPDVHSVHLCSFCLMTVAVTKLELFICQDKKLWLFLEETLTFQLKGSRRNKVKFSTKRLHHWLSCSIALENRCNNIIAVIILSSRLQHWFVSVIDWNCLKMTKKIKSIWSKCSKVCQWMLFWWVLILLLEIWLKRLSEKNSWNKWCDWS